MLALNVKKRTTGADASGELHACIHTYMLTLQLKRFDFDYYNMYRIKISDK